MKLHVLHRTHFSYRAPVRDSLNEVRLQPTDTPEQRVHAFELKITPQAQPKHQLDFYHNHVHRFDLLSPHQELAVEAISSIETLAPAPPGAAAATPLATMSRCIEMDRCYDFLQSSAYVPLDDPTRELARTLTATHDTAWDATLAIFDFIHNEFRYQPAITNVHTKSSEALRLRCGVCQDFAHVMIGLCRTLLIPARYVSGYLYNGPADQLRGAQASHAWIEVFLPGRGWIGLDPTNHQLTNERHVKIAIGRDYADVSPLRGTYRGTSQRTLKVDVLVSRLDEATRTADQLQSHTLVLNCVN
jgi:transglutaminase-like putative cysteine protease